MPSTPNATSLGHKDLNLSSARHSPNSTKYLLSEFDFSHPVVCTDHDGREKLVRGKVLLWRSGSNISGDAEWLIPSVAPIRPVIGLLCRVWCQPPPKLPLSPSEETAQT